MDTAPAPVSKAPEGLPPPATSSSAASSATRSGFVPERWRDFLMEDVDEKNNLTTIPLVGYCLMTGWIDVVAFSSIFVWCAFQTGNSVQLAIALARLFQGPAGHHDGSFHLADKFALTSLLTFLFGAFCGRVGDKIGCKTRLWLFGGTFFQALLTMAAAIALWKGGQRSVADERSDIAWSNACSYAALGLISMSMGLQGIMGKRVNTQFTTTIVLTTTWCELMADPKLFEFRKLVISRDHKSLAIAALFIGGFSSRAILQGIGSPAALGIGCGIRCAIALSWFFIPPKKKAHKN